MPNELLTNLFNSLRQLGFSPKHIIDVGAHCGGWSRVAMAHFPTACFTLIEPQARLRPHLTDLIELRDQVDFLPVGAGNKSGILNFTLHDRHDSCSFAYSEEAAAAQNFQQIELEVMTLNEIARNSRFTKPDMIKIDAEGFDLEVLSGALDLVESVELFLIEAAVTNPLYKNTVMRVINEMHQLGYSLFDVSELNRPIQVGVLWLVELAFIKSGGSIEKSLKAVQSIPLKTFECRDIV